ncbi:homeobox protein Hox-A3-like [Saccostrea echinata]|uniref:homeobox protein Hox-A3-like n=1 Tax=Saccostrea echinata TaxID=191078 RepID=UPI002A82733C|nr:homeobox protein Hox-A3-like [Saccostrea echinata]
MLAMQTVMQSEITKTPANVPVPLALEHIDNFCHSQTADKQAQPTRIPETEVNNNKPDEPSKKDSFLYPGNYFPHMGLYSAQNSYKCIPLDNDSNASNTVIEQKTCTPSISKDSFEHVLNVLASKFTGYSGTSSQHKTTAEKVTVNSNSLQPPSHTHDVIQPCKKRRLSGTQNQRIDITHNQMVPVVKSVQSDMTDSSLSKASGPETQQKTPETPPNPGQFYYNSPQYLPFYPQPMCGIFVPDSQQVPQANDTTHLIPSRQSPIMSTYQTPKSRTKKVCQRRLTSPAESDKSSDISRDEDSEADISVVDARGDAKDKSIAGDTSKDSDISMVSVKSNKSTSPSSSSTGSPSTVSPDEVSRKKARTNYTPQQVQTLEKVFHENPYPDAEKMEELSKELEIPESKLKVWFQNKRARWRRRMNDNAHQVPRLMGPSTMMSPMSPYGFIGHMMPPPMSPAQVVPGHFVRPGPSSSPPSTSPGNKQTSQVTPPYQSRGHFPPYIPIYPYGMFSPYYYS